MRPRFAYTINVRQDGYELPIASVRLENLPQAINELSGRGIGPYIASLFRRFDDRRKYVACDRDAPIGRRGFIVERHEALATRYCDGCETTECGCADLTTPMPARPIVDDAGIHW